MTIQVSPSPTTAELSPAMKRAAYLAHLLEIAQQAQSTQPRLSAWRDRALTQVKAQAFPSTRDEEWRFTDLSPLLDVEFGRVKDQRSTIEFADLDTFLLPETANSRLVFVDGM
jgi:Fe-S cluster assembly protein SufD